MRYNFIPAWLRELTFVTDFFSWLFALLSRLAEPFMLLAVLYVVAEAGVPSITSPALHNLSVAIMICSPELVLPGAFVVARQSQQYAKPLYVVCWCFVALTLVTLISLFVWRMSGDERAWLMSARCATAFAYSILMRVMFHGSQTESSEQSEQATNKSEHEAIHALIERIEQLSLTVTQITTTVTEIKSEQLSLPERTTIIESEQNTNTVERIRSALYSNPELTDRELAAIVEVAPSTANKWRKRIESESVI